MSADVAIEIQGVNYAADIAPRILVNGFPKAGTHLALILVAILAEPWRDGDEGKLFHMGTFNHNSWSHEWLDPWNACKLALYQPPRTWMVSHVGYYPQLQRAMERRGTCMVFIYRDLRDVAVSMLHHIMDDKHDWRHGERELYIALPDDEARLLAILNGIGKDPGLVARWRLYAPWIDVDWVHAVKFEDVIGNHAKAAEDALQYVIVRTAQVNQVQASLKLDDYLKMVQSTVDMLERPKEFSGTYRKGKSGGWRDYWTPAIAEAFDRTGGNEWLARLGYEV